MADADAYFEEALQIAIAVHARRGESRAGPEGRVYSAGDGAGVTTHLFTAGNSEKGRSQEEVFR